MYIFIFYIDYLYLLIPIYFCTNVYMNMDVFLGWKSVESLRYENTPKKCDAKAHCGYYANLPSPQILIYD